jgi:hypothetical protein
MGKTRWGRQARRKDEPEPIDAILARAGEDRYAPKRPALPFVVWRAAVGPRIAEQAVPISLEGGTLLLRTTSSTWASELSMLGDVIRARLREHGVVVDQLRFRTGRLELPTRPVERRAMRTIPAPVPLPPPLRNEVDGIADDELRAEVARAAAQSLAFNEWRRGARGPRSAGTESAPPDRTAAAAREAPPRSPSGDRGRSR